LTRAGDLNPGIVAGARTLVAHAAWYYSGGPPIGIHASPILR
jgi:hypothetical protein